MQLIVPWVLAAFAAGALAAPVHSDAQSSAAKGLTQGAGVTSDRSSVSDLRSILTRLSGDDTDDRASAIAALAAQSDSKAGEVIQALSEDRLETTDDHQMVIVSPSGERSFALTGAAAPEGGDPFVLNNRLRAVLQAALAARHLLSGTDAERIAAADGVAAQPDPNVRDTVQNALATSTSPVMAHAFQRAMDMTDLASADASRQSRAAESLRTLAQIRDRAYLQTRLDALSPDARQITQGIVRALERRQQWHGWVSNVFFGLSLASVLLLTALGLAITFGLLGVINMAHGELLMLGAYSTYVTEHLISRWLPSLSALYPVAAIPIAFAVSAVVGMVMERTIIRHLYGRPLETLLATWGVSLLLMQGVRSLFGPQNVEVSNPSWMSGGITVAEGISLPLNRLVILAFSLAVLGLSWLFLYKTRAGLFVRAVTQNRAITDCMGVSTARVDMLAFGLGGGIAGLGGVALSQLGNVGPDLGQSYIIDSFMIVVLGGVGQLAGCAIAALGLGELSKLLEPGVGAVVAKIVLLAFVVLFIQRRPQGLFELRVRTLD